MSTDTKKHVHFYKFFDAPLTYVIVSGLDFEAGMLLAEKAAKGKAARVIVLCYWHVPNLVNEIAAFKEKQITRFSNFQLTYLCPTLEGTLLLKKMGVDALHVHPNAFLDEKIFRPNPQAEKNYAAAHNANLLDFKRHYLAWGVRDLALITYNVLGAEQIANFAGYKYLKYCNFSQETGAVFLKNQQVAAILRASKCGLILSELEGGNYATTEYLLSGIPVVSTPSVGGRDEFFDQRHVKIVEPIASEVEKAVAEWNVAIVDPMEIHAAVLLKMRQHRLRFLTWFSEVTGLDHVAGADENLWSPLFTNKLIKTVVISKKKPFVLMIEKIYRGMMVFPLKLIGWVRHRI